LNLLWLPEHTGGAQRADASEVTAIGATFWAAAHSMSDMSIHPAVPSLHMDSVHPCPVPAADPVRSRGGAKAAPPPGKICAFRCTYRTSLSEYDHGGLYLAAYEGDIHVFLDEDNEQLAGHARLFVLNADAAERDGESLFNLLDQRRETAAFIPLLGDGDGELSPTVCDILGEPSTASCNMLLLERLDILPAFRGQDLGLKYVSAAITRFGLGCRLVAACVPPGVLPARERAARTRLAKYCTRAGFVPVRRSGLMILDMETPRAGLRSRAPPGDNPQ
jgi:hypothetical protein